VASPHSRTTTGHTFFREADPNWRAGQGLSLANRNLGDHGGSKTTSPTPAQLPRLTAARGDARVLGLCLRRLTSLCQQLST
jgi:hypothetical protein